MKVESLQVVLEVLLQELNCESGGNDNEYLPYKSFKLPEKLFTDIIPDVLENVVEDIRKKAKEESKNGDSVQKIIFKAMFLIFLHTTQQERFMHLRDLLDHFYNKLIQKLIELKKCSSIMALETFNEIVIKLLPFVKLQIVKDICEYENFGNELKVSLMELYEIVLYPNISREDCYEIVKNKIKYFEDLTFLDFEIKPVNEKNGFLGEYFNLKIFVNNGGYNETHHFFLKHKPFDSDELRKIIAEISFKKEEAFYMKIIPYLRQLGFSEVTDFLPECYLTRSNKFMVFDDACFNDFVGLDIKVPFSYKQLSLILKKLAKFHSCGILFEEKISKILRTNFRLNNYYKDMLVESFAIRNNAQTEIFFNCSIRTNNYAFDKFPHIFKPGTLETFKQKCSEAYNRYYDIVESSETNRNFVTHGDLWCNNILFKRDGTSCMLIDFQIIRYNSPVYDIYFLLATNTDLNTRRTCGPKLLHEYYFNLKHNLSQYDVNINKFLTYEQFLNNLETVKPISLIVALSYLLVMLLPKEKMAPIYADPELSQAFFAIDRSKVLDELWDTLKCTSRYEGIIQELYALLNKT